MHVCSATHGVLSQSAMQASGLMPVRVAASVLELLKAVSACNAEVCGMCVKSGACLIYLAVLAVFAVVGRSHARCASQLSRSTARIS